MQDVPTEVIHEILAFSTSHDLICSHCRVNTEWYMWAQEDEQLWRQRCLQYVCYQTLDVLRDLCKTHLQQELEKQEKQHENKEQLTTLKLTKADLTNSKIYQRLENELALLPTHLEPRYSFSHIMVESAKEPVESPLQFKFPSFVHTQGPDYTQYTTEQQRSQFTRLRVGVTTGEYEWLRQTLNRDPLDDQEAGSFFDNDENILSDRPFPTDSDKPLTLPVFYFELSLDAPRFTDASIGLAVQQFSFSKQPGWTVGSYGYHSDDGDLFNAASLGSQALRNRFGVGDTVGMGIWLPTNDIFVTKNGEFLGIAFKNQNCSPLYPCVGTWKPLLAHVNFGRNQPFKFNLRDLANKITDNNIIDASCYRSNHYSYSMDDWDTDSISSDTYSDEGGFEYVPIQMADIIERTLQEAGIDPAQPWRGNQDAETAIRRAMEAELAAFDQGEEFIEQAEADGEWSEEGEDGEENIGDEDNNNLDLTNDNNNNNNNENTA